LPTYAYRCADCGHRFETVQSFTDEALTVCPVCNGVLRKVFNAVGVVFKGSGFYRTDSRAAALASGGNGSDAGKGSNAKSSDSSSGAGDGASGSSSNGSEANGSGSKGSGSKGSGSKGSAAKDTSSKSGASTGAGGSKTPTG
jgi:putative FmdB family regulatory protein